MEAGDIPVIDQGESFTAGFTLRSNRYQGSLPVVLFGDHTRRVKYVDFEFAIGADGVKVLEPRPGLDAKYLYFYLRSLRIPNSGYSRHFKFLREFRVPMSAPAEQQRTVDFLTRAEGIVRLRREAQRKAAELIPAIFIDMFGDPSMNPKGWPTASLGELLAAPIRNGTSPSRAGRHAGHVLTLSAITRGRFDPKAMKESTFAAPLAPHDAVSMDDFLICRGNGNSNLVGTGCFPTADMPTVAFPDTAIAVRPDRTRLNHAYLSAYWKTGHARAAINRIAKTTNGTFKINQTGVTGLSIPLPPLIQQSAFADIAARMESVEQQQSAALTTAQATFNALLAQAFTR